MSSQQDAHAVRRTAVVVGATGLVGDALLRKLSSDSYWTSLVAWCRRPGPELPKVMWSIVDFDATLLGDESPGEILLPPEADVFCCLGTTLKSAGTRERFERVDRDYVIALAQHAASKKANSFVLVSSLGADQGSKNFYLRTKGRAEKGVQETSLRSVTVVRPSLLLGDRQEHRLGEAVARRTSGLWSLLLLGPLKRYRPVHASEVAEVMFATARTAVPGMHIVQPESIRGRAVPTLR